MSSARAPLGLRLTAWYALLFASGIALVLSISYALTARALYQRDQAAILGRTQELARDYARSGIRELQEESRETHGLTLNRFIVRLCRPRGETLLLDAPPDLARTQGPAMRAAPCGAGGWSRLKPAGASILHVLTTELPDGARIQVALADQERRDLLFRLKVAALATLIPAFLFAGAAGYFMTIKALRPLRSLLAAAEAIEGGDLSARVAAPGGGDELDALSRLFNKMLDRIGRLISGMRESLDHIAHDLRTPAARLRAAAEAALKRPLETGSDREALADCVEESQRMCAILDTLMDLAEAESGASRPNPRDVELRPLLEESAELYRLEAEESGYVLELECAEELVARADTASLRRILANLLGNAIKYGGSKGRIRLSAQARGDRIAVAVKDDGAGIAPVDLPRIFDRLYRSRAAAGKSGLGLGLSLVKALAEAQGASVTAENAAAGGALFTVFLPKGGKCTNA